MVEVERRVGVISLGGDRWKGLALKGNHKRVWAARESRFVAGKLGKQLSKP